MPKLSRLIWVFAAGAACSDPVAPIEDPHINGPVRPYFTLNTVTYTLGQTAPENPSFAMALDPFPEPTLAIVAFDGILTVSHWGGGFITKIDPRGYWHSGQTVCAAQVSITFSVRGSWKPGCASSITTPKYGEQSHVETLTTLHGSGTARRGQAIPVFGTCGTNPCHRYTGEQTVTITPIEADLALTPQSKSVQPGGGASFTASRSPATHEGKSVPWRVRSWTWLPDSGNPVALTACGVNATCPVSNRQMSGIVKCDAFVNGEAESRMARLNVVPCPTNDSCLDEAAVRKGLADAWNRSRSLGRELGGVLYRRISDGSCFHVEINDPGATRCTYDPPSGANIPSYPDAYPVAFWHSHPNKTGETVVCGPKKTGTAAPYSNGGGSGKLTDKRGDWASSKNSPVYAVAPALVYRLDPNGDGSTPQDNPNFWFWNTPQCQW